MNDDMIPEIGEFPTGSGTDSLLGQGRRLLIGNGFNLAMSVCHSRFRLQSCEEAAMPQPIGRGYCSQEYDSSNCGGIKIGGVIAKKLTLLFHIP